MTQDNNKYAQLALLPTGFRDILPAKAAHMTKIIVSLLQDFQSSGYQRVIPPLVEFEESLFSQTLQSTNLQSFRIFDSQTQKQMAIRSDITLQISRLAATRLSKSPRPLRLSYWGDVLRVQGASARPERQLSQAGLELIGIDTAEADAEIIILTVQALNSLGIIDMSIDFVLPTLIPTLLKTFEKRSEIILLNEAIYHKDRAAILKYGQEATPILISLLDCCGPIEKVLSQFQSLALSEPLRSMQVRLQEVVSLVRIAHPKLEITLDLMERQGFEYHTGLAFTFFTQGFPIEIGRGGRYYSFGETATGVTLYPDYLMEVTPPPVSKKKVYIPLGTDSLVAQKFRSDGWITIFGLDKNSPWEEARRLDCQFIYEKGSIQALS
jgi:ATP phosphoribosyltransferase regulatory subunit